MSVKITAQPKRDVVTFLSDVDVGFVSLVKHGANWTPWTTIKNDGKVNMPGQVIQSILLPIDRDISTLKEQFGDEWFGRVKSDQPKQFKALKRYTQLSEELFQEHARGAAFRLTDIPGGGFFVSGSLKAAKADALMVPEIEPMEATVATVDRGPMDISFADMFYSKIDDYVSVVRGIMGLNGDAQTRIRAHNDAWKAVDAFVRNALTQIGNQTIKMDVVRPEAGNTDTGDSLMNDEQLKAFIAELAGSMKSALTEGFEAIKTSIADLNPHKSEEVPVAPTAATEPEWQKPLADMVSAIAGLKDDIKSLAQKTEALEHVTVSQPSDSADVATDTDDIDVDPNAPFKGMFDLGI